MFNFRLALQRSGRVLLADDMGLGKTVQSLAIAVAYRSEWPFLIVCPSSVRFTWRNQVIRWLGQSLGLNLDKICVVNTAKDLSILNGYQNNQTQVTIISYDLMARFGKDLWRHKFKVVIMVRNFRFIIIILVI